MVEIKILGNRCVLSHIHPLLGKHNFLLPICPITNSANDHIDATLPNAFSDAAFDGREVRFTMHGRCGDPEAGVMENWNMKCFSGDIL